MSRISARYIIDDVPTAMHFYTTLLGFTLEQDASPAFASVVRDGFEHSGWAAPYAAMQQAEAGEAFANMGVLLFGR